MLTPGLTPQGGTTPQIPGAMPTPLRTPARDKLNINMEEEYADPEYAQYQQVGILMRTPKANEDDWLCHRICYLWYDVHFGVFLQMIVMSLLMCQIQLTT